jgi:hypothetical protein
MFLKVKTVSSIIAKAVSAMTNHNDKEYKGKNV